MAVKEEKYIGLDEDTIAYLENSPFHTLYDKYGNLIGYDELPKQKGYTMNDNDKNSENEEVEKEEVPPVMRERKNLIRRYRLRRKARKLNARWIC
ncbi:hypothetical protein [Helicobacter suis]|uniref:hypothetical protein n=1 Tax=Helicobacter suis TaxID=104628 RepID=UPI0013D1765B|nr:hypothetical protein [Helicobacter suis]